ncbi:MAG: tetratricopeptide repeat protein [Planctomycetales bacterium]|nr:tetratricopeptide repeat protein [Planctomycetales bacterium]
MNGSQRRGSAHGLILAASIAVLLCLCGLWFYLRSGNLQPSEESRNSVLNVHFDEPEFAEKPEASQLLALAERTVASVLIAFPQSAQAYNVKANRDYLVSDTAAAESAWLRATELEPTNPDALFGLALLAFESGRYADAIAICEDLMQLAPSNPRIPLLLADIYIHDSQPEKAALILEQHIASAPTSVQAFEMLGNAYLQSQRYERASECFDLALQHAPNSKDSYYGLARAYGGMGDREQAKLYSERFNELARGTSQEHSEQAQKFEDRDHAAHIAAQVYVDSAAIYRDQGDFVRAADYLLRAQKLQPDVVGWLEELQRMYFSAGEFASASDVGQRLVDLEPNNLEQWLNLGHLYAEQGRTRPAIEAFSRAIELSPDDPRCQKAKGIISSLGKL